MKFLKKIFHRKVIQFFVSEMDQFLLMLNQKFPKKSASQREEITKYERIFGLRDRVVKEQGHRFWRGF